MKRYVEQLLADITYATENVEWPYEECESGIEGWMSDEEEERTAPRRDLEEWTGIHKTQLPPEDRLTDEQVQRLLNALKGMLDAYNWSFVLQTCVPERIQYAAIRDNFDQEALVKRWNMGFFQLCRSGTPHGTCALGEYCQCRFYEELFSGFVDAELSLTLRHGCICLCVAEKGKADWLEAFGKGEVIGDPVETEDKMILFAPGSLFQRAEVLRDKYEHWLLAARRLRSVSHVSFSSSSNALWVRPMDSRA
jgi:hypothetical protein